MVKIIACVIQSRTFRVFSKIAIVIAILDGAIGVVGDVFSAVGVIFTEESDDVAVGIEDAGNTIVLTFVHHELADFAISTVDLLLVQVPLTRILALKAGACPGAILFTSDEL